MLQEIFSILGEHKALNIKDSKNIKEARAPYSYTYEVHGCRQRGRRFRRVKRLCRTPVCCILKGSLFIVQLAVYNVCEHRFIHYANPSIR